MRSRVVFAALGAAFVAVPAGTAHAGIAPNYPISIGMAPYAPRAGSVVQLTAGAAPPGATYVWDLNGDGAFDDATGATATATFTAGTHTVRERATSDQGITTDTRTFDVHAWDATPTGSIDVSAASASVGHAVTVTAKGADPDGPAPQVALDLDGDGTFETPGDSVPATFATTGEHVIRARFTDDAGATAVATRTLSVHATNFPPVVTAERFGTVASAGAGVLAGLTAVATDPDGKVVRYEYDLDGDGTYETDGGAHFDIPASAPGATEIGVRVTDDAGATATWRGNDGVVGPAVAEVGQPTTFYGTADDVWDADDDGDFDDGNGSTVKFTYSTPGTYMVRAKSGSRIDSTTIAVRDAAGSPPPSPVLTLSPARPGKPISVSFGPTPIAGYRDWPVSALDVDGDGQFDDATASPLLTTFTGPATVSVKATGFDGQTSVTTGQVAWLPGGPLPPDAVLSAPGPDPVPLVPAWGEVWGGGSDTDGFAVTGGFDLDGDGDYDDAPITGPTGDQSLFANPRRTLGLRVTNGAGSTTVTRTIGIPAGTPLPGVVTPPKAFTFKPYVKKVRLATLLKRGIVIEPGCGKGCRVAVGATIAKATAKRLKLHSRTVGKATSTKSSVRLKLSAKARKALEHARSVKLTLTVAATNSIKQKATAKTTFTIRR